MRRWWWLILTVPLAGVVFSGCKKKAPPTGPALPMPTAKAPQPPAPSAQTTAPAQKGEQAKKEETKIVYTCEMHPEVVQDKPGKCPKCGMYLKAKVPEGVEVEYYCPMHPDVVQDKPGECPECKMPLHARIKGKTETSAGGTTSQAGETATPSTEGGGTK